MANAIPAQKFEGDKTALYALMAEWDKAKVSMIDAIEHEMTLRKQVNAMAFPVDSGGTKRIELEGGFNLKQSMPEKFEFDKDFAKVRTAYDAICKVGNVGAMLAARLFKFSADLAVKEYKALDPANSNDEKQIKDILDSVLTTKYGAPALEIEPPKTRPGPILAHSLK